MVVVIIVMVVVIIVMVVVVIVVIVVIIVMMALFLFTGPLSGRLSKARYIVIASIAVYTIHVKSKFSTTPIYSTREGFSIGIISTAKVKLTF